MRCILIVQICFTLLLAGQASGALVEVDLENSGDGLITRDTATGLDWLDPSTPNLSPSFCNDDALPVCSTSVEDILDGWDDWIDNGWRYATTDEICELFSKSYLGLEDCPGAVEDSALDGVISDFQDLLGTTRASCLGGWGCTYTTNGYFDDGDLDDGLAGIATALRTWASDDVVEVALNEGATDAYATHLLEVKTGHFLVRASPPGDLVEADLEEPGDGLITRDTATGLDWLDPSTPNLSPAFCTDAAFPVCSTSVEDILDGWDDWIDNGWRYATTDEICELFSKFNLGLGNCPGEVEDSALDDVIFDFQEFFGTTRTSCLGWLGCTYITNGYFDDGDLDDGLAGIATARIVAAPNLDEVEVALNEGATDAHPAHLLDVKTGHFLVRATPQDPVPVPSLGPMGFGLLVTGLLWLGWRTAFRKHREHLRSS